MSLRPGPIDVHAMAREALELASTILMQKRLQVTIALEAAQSQVEGDAVRLRQLFGNLIANAVKFTPPGGDITLSSWNSPGVIALEVRDSGAGISAEALPRLFTAFEQGDRTPGSHGGLGLGLAISKGIVDLHGGRITASSEGPGRGARFVVELPLLREVAQLADREVKARVLLVEDNPDTASALTLALSASGYRVQRAESVGAALRSDLGGVDLVLSDVNLPDGDGRALLRHLHQQTGLPTIVLSGQPGGWSPQDEGAIFARLTKPVAMERLMETIDRAVAAARQR
jgi:CheY-like chemotaxis protein